MPPREARDPGERPLLRLGLAGYTAKEVADLQGILMQGRVSAAVTWELGGLGNADAWCVNAARARPLSDGTLHVSPGLPSGRSLRVQMDAIDLPVAFSNPRPEFQPSPSFRIEQPDGLRAMLAELEERLRPLLVQYRLAAQILERRIDLRRVHHVSADNRLLAVMSKRQGAAIQPAVPIQQLDRAIWTPRPDAAGVAPSHFVRLPVDQLMWQYALRTRREWLPAQYRSARLYLRRPPELPLRLLTDHSLLLVRELGTAPGTMKELGERTGLTAREISLCLGALALVGSVTSDPARALSTRQAGKDEGSQKDPAESDRGILSLSGLPDRLNATVKLRVRRQAAAGPQPGAEPRA